MKRILVYGYGNPGRQDDGLGILLAEKVKEWGESQTNCGIMTDSNYQLNIEDAYKLNEYDAVIYADASIEEIDNCQIEQIEPVLNPRFSMHSVSPEFVLGLCHELYSEVPDTYLVHIKGYEWEFMEELSNNGKANLEKAFELIKDKINEIATA